MECMDMLLIILEVQQLAQETGLKCYQLSFQEKSKRNIQFILPRLMAKYDILLYFPKLWKWTDCENGFYSTVKLQSKT